MNGQKLFTVSASVFDVANLELGGFYKLKATNTNESLPRVNHEYKALLVGKSREVLNFAMYRADEIRVVQVTIEQYDRGDVEIKEA